MPGSRCRASPLDLRRHTADGSMLLLAGVKRKAAVRWLLAAKAWQSEAFAPQSVFIQGRPPLPCA